MIFPRLKPRCAKPLRKPESRPPLSRLRAIWVAISPALTPDPREVAEIFEVPLAYLCNPATLRRESREIAGRQRSFYAFTYKEHEIWGATAAIIVDLAQRLNGISKAS